MNVTAKPFLAGSVALLLAACGDSAKLPEEAAFGPHPALPEPTETTIPTINIARAKGWPQGASPTPSAGLSVQAFAVGLDHPRWLYVLPNGDVLVAETNAPPRPEDDRGVKGSISRIEQSRAGAGVQSANRITLLRDDGSGVAGMRTVFLQGLNSPFGLGQHVDPRVTPQRPDLVAKAIKPDYALGNHTASLGLAFSAGAFLPERYRHGAFIGQHGSWNRRPRSGYKVIFVPFSDGRPSGLPVDVLTGFASGGDEALGRPVGVAIDRSGALLVADDVGNRVWRVGPAVQAATETLKR
jgi:glucose/arabinose dehydrogenase